jgi:hypothetical protein
LIFGSSLSGRADGGGGTNTLDDAAFRTPVKIDLTTGTATGVAGGVRNIQAIRGGQGNDILIGSAAGGTAFLASPGNDTVTGLGVGNTLTGTDADSTWHITGPNAGTLTFAAGTTRFAGAQGLTGGAGLDIFKPSTTGTTAVIDGGGGSNWLDYRAFPANVPVEVNLATGSATGVGGGAAGLVSNLQNVWAGAGNTKLTGDAQGNVLVGGAGNSILTGGTGRSVLVGGTGRSQITGNSNDDLLLGGTLSADLNETALPLILAEWQRTDLPYNQRVADLRNGGGLNGGYKLLWGTTVLAGSPADQLTGGGGQDWFFQFPGQQVIGAAAGAVVENQPPVGGQFRRAFSIGGVGLDDSYNVTTDAQDNVYVIGDFEGTVNFNPNGTPVYLTAAAGTNGLGVDGYLAKFSPTGMLLWVQQFATDAADVAEAIGITVDAADSVLVTGWITGPTAFGSITLPGITGGSTSDNTVAFVAKVDPEGDVLWADQLGSSDASTDTWCESVTTDASANVYVAGSFTGTPTIGGTTLTSAGTADAFVARLNASGTIQWVENTAAVSNYSFGTGIAVDEAGNVYSTGQFTGTGKFGSYSLTSQGGSDIFVTEINSSGTTLWARDLGTPGTDVGIAIVVDKSGNIYVGGYANGNNSRVYGQVYVAQLTSTGSVVWSRQYGDPAGGNAAASLALDSSGNLYVGGLFQSTIAFDTFSFTSAGPANGFILKLNGAGTVQWSHALIGPGNNYYQAIVAVDPSLNVYAVGNFEQTLSFDNDLQGTYNLASAGSWDGYVLELSQRGPLVYTAPPGATADGYTLQLTQGYLQVVDNRTGQVVAEKSVDDTTSVMVNGFSSASQLTTATLQETIGTLSAAAPGTPLVLGVDPGLVGAALSAVDGMAPPPNPITVVLNLAPGTYPDLKASLPAGVTLVINGNGHTTTIVGHSPALTVTAGTVLVNGMILTTATASPTILVSGGSLTLRSDVIQESTGSNQAAVQITGGTVDLGTATGHGLNTLNVNGPGDLIVNTGPSPVTALGDTFEHNGIVITSPYAIEDHIFDALYAGGGGLVTYVANNVYVTRRSGSIQRAIDAVPAGYTVNVKALRQDRDDCSHFQDYTVGSKPLTVAFQNGPTLQLAADSALAADSTTLRVTGGPQDHTHIAFERGDRAGAIEVKIGGLPTGTFAPTGGIVAHGGGGSHARIEVDPHITLLALLFADGADAHLEGGGGPTVEVGGGGDHTVLEGGRGRNLLIAGPGPAHLKGRSQDDILIGGTVNFGANEEAALVALIREWARTDEDFATRVANVTGDTGSPDFTADRRNGSYFLQAHTTVFDNLARDHMEGGGGNNLYFAAWSGLDKDRWDAVIPRDKVIAI